jgi:hypothetical protein
MLEDLRGGEEQNRRIPKKKVVEKILIENVCRSTEVVGSFN